MKQGRLGPGKKAKDRGSTFKSRGGRPARGIRGNPKTRAQSKKWPGATGWTQRVFALYGRVCLACPRKDPKPATQAHHVIPKQVIVNARHLSPEERAQLAYDARNGLPICEQCHMDHEYAPDWRIPRVRLLPDHFEWAADHGFRYFIEKREIYP